MMMLGAELSVTASLTLIGRVLIGYLIKEICENNLNQILRDDVVCVNHDVCKMNIFSVHRTCLVTSYV